MYYDRGMTKKLGVGALRQGLPEALEQVEQHGVEVVVTRHNTAVAKLVPMTAPALPRIMALTSLKGGVGKTTIALHLAQVLVNDGHEVVILDADSERSAQSWAKEASRAGPLGFDVAQANPDTLMRQARDFANQGKFVLIDTPPNERDILRSAAMVADLVFVPLLPTGMDVDRMARTLVQLRDIEAVRDNFAYSLLLNRCDNRKRISRETKEMVADFPLLDAVIPPLTVYESAFGKVPAALGPFTALWQEVKDKWGES